MYAIRSYYESLDGIDALLNEDAGSSEYRDGASGARLQHETCDQPAWCAKDHRGDLTRSFVFTKSRAITQIWRPKIVQRGSQASSGPGTSSSHTATAKLGSFCPGSGYVPAGT